MVAGKWLPMLSQQTGGMRQQELEGAAGGRKRFNTIQEVL